MRTDRSEGGSLTLFVAVVVVGLLFAFGLVLDGGYLLAARRATLNEADGAARAGAQQVAPESIAAAGPVILDPDAVTAAVRAFLAPTGHESSVVVDQDTVTVTVRSTYRMRVLPVGSRRVTGVGTAHAQRGI